MNNHKYFQSEENKVKNEWLSATADERRIHRVSKPYIIQIRNVGTVGAGPDGIINTDTSADPIVLAGDDILTNESIANVDIGDAYANRAASNFGQSLSIRITSLITGTSYREFLAETESQSFRVGRTMIICTTAAQFNETIAITHRDANGNRKDEVTILTLDPYQQQTDRIISDDEYLFDGYTRLRFSNIRASATVTLRLYPTDKFSATQLIAGRPAQVQYNAPKIIKVLPSSA